METGTKISKSMKSSKQKSKFESDSDDIDRAEQESIMKAQIESLNEELAASRKRYDELQNSHKEEVLTLKMKLRSVQEENVRLKERVRIIAGEEEEKMDELDLEKETKGRYLRNYKKWSGEEFLEWIMGIESGKYKKYEHRLAMAFRREGVTGDAIRSILRCDWRAWGVTDYKDTMALNGHVTDLIDGTFPM